MNRSASRAVAALAGLALSLSSFAQTSAAAGTSTRSASFMVSVVVDSDCLISSTTALNFGHIGARLGFNPSVFFAQASQVSRISIACSKNTRYTLYMDQGSVAGSTLNTRLMAGNSPGNTDKLQYQLYLDPAYSTLWGDAASGSSNSVSGIGDGSPQTYAVYGRILEQTMPTPDLYSSMITASLTF